MKFMNKKGFTLAEVMGVIVLLAALALVVIPLVDKQLKESNQKLYDSSIDSLKNSIGLYMADKNLDINESLTISLYQLKQTGLVDTDFKNPVTGELFANDIIITIKNIDGALEYDINDKDATNKSDYKSLPEMVLNKSVIEYVELGEEFIVDAGDVTSRYGSESLITTAKSNVDDTKVGVYTIEYSTTYKNMKNKIYRTIIIKDTKGPTISFKELELPLNEAKTYDYKSDIVVNDLSGVKSIEVETKFGSLKGLYSVKYIITDNVGNKTIKYRKVITS